MKRRAAVAMLTLAVLATASIGGANAWIGALARDRIHAQASTLPRAAVAIVPGARVRDDGSPSAALRDRLQTALDAYRAGKVRSVLVSGDGAVDQDGVMARWLVAHGVPEAHVQRDARGLRTWSTFENASRSGVDRAIVCTQRFHLPRALAIARHFGIDAVGLAADRRIYPHQREDDLREALARTLAAAELLVR